MLTNRTTVVATTLQQVLKDNAENLGLKDVWFGDQDTFPRVPCVAVEPVDMVRPDPTPMMISFHEMECYITVYDIAIGNQDKLQLATDQLAEQIADTIHADPDTNEVGPLFPDGRLWTLRGTLTIGWVTRIEHGFAVKGGKLMRCARLTYVGRSRVPILMTGG